MAASKRPTSVVPPEFHAPLWVYGAAGLLSLVLYVFTVESARNGRWWLAGILAFVGSYGLWAFTRCIVDRRTLVQAFSPKTQSWAMLCDILIAGAVALAAFAAHRYLNHNGWYFSLWWLATAYVAGWLLSLSWQHFLDHPNYDRAGAGALLYDPAKIGHDDTTYSYLAAMIVFVVVPVLATALWVHSPIPYALVAVVLVWAMAGIFHDGGKRPDGRPRLNPYELHTPYNYKTWQPAPGYRPTATGR